MSADVNVNDTGNRQQVTGLPKFAESAPAPHTITGNGYQQVNNYRAYKA